MTTPVVQRVACPAWCVVDHAAEDAYEQGVAAAHGHAWAPDSRGPLHRGADILVGQQDNGERGWAFAQLIQDEGVTRVYLNDEEVTLDVAEGLADALRSLVDVGRQSLHGVSIESKSGRAADLPQAGGR